jgi:DNA uptake protein ComE-like DNA-binding protein
MGINERDYMRRDPWTSFAFGKILLLLAGVVAVLVVVEFAQTSQLTDREGISKGSLRLNINSAAPEELESIPGIGGSRAEAIINHRPYASVDELISKHALGPKMTESIRKFVKVDGATEPMAKSPAP